MYVWEYQRNNKKYADVIRDIGFGRIVMYTTANKIDETNILDELSEALNVHYRNAEVIRYLDRYYRGDQPVLYREKKVRPEINNKVVENHALEIVESKVADLYGEPIQYVLSDNDDDAKADQMSLLNRYMKSEDKAALDIERGRWASIAGTSYFYVGNENRMPKIFDEAPFYITCESPLDTFVVYYADDKTAAYSCQLRKDNDGEFQVIHTPEWIFAIRNGKIVDKKGNGNDMIPVIEYPNNERRLSDIEITIGITDAINDTQSDRQNAIEQFVQAFMLFKNCEIDKQTFVELRESGAISVKDSADGKTADVKTLVSELSQEGSQVSKDDLYNSLLTIQGMPSRQEATGGDTGQAVALRNGYYAEEKRAELRVPIFTKSERMLLRVILNKLRVDRWENGFNLSISDIDIRPNRSKLENMMVKAQVLQILHGIGVDDSVALKTVNLFSDVQDTYIKSKDRMDEQFESSLSKTSEVVEVENGDTTI